MSQRATTGLVTLTPSPAIDRTYRLTELFLGEVNRATDVMEEFAGKGVNVSRNLALSGIIAPAVVPLSALDRALVDEDPLIRVAPCTGRVRVNITAIESTGATTKINQSAPELTASEWDELVGTAVNALEETSSGWLLVAGSFPKVAGGTASAEALRGAVGPHVKLALDTSGDVFEVWARSGMIDFVKPNVRELGDAVGRVLSTMGDVLEAAREVADWGVPFVMVSMGADGFLGHVGGEDWWAWSEPVDVKNTIGAGDASVSGFFAALLNGPDNVVEAVANAARWGAQKVQQGMSQLQHLEGLPLVTVTSDIDRSRPVTAE